MSGGAFLVFSVALAIVIDRLDASAAGARGSEPDEARPDDRLTPGPGQPLSSERGLRLVGD